MRSNANSQNYLHLLPLDSSDKIDVFSVFNRIYPQITQFVEQFIAQTSWETDIHADSSHVELFRHFYFESKNNLKTVGQHTFGFGFPIVFDKNIGSNTAISAPLFIWQLGIRPNPNRLDSWIISFEEGAAIAINEYLIQYFKQTRSVDLTDFLTEYVHNRPFNKNGGFDAFIKNLAKRLDFDLEHINPGLRACAAEKNALEVAEKSNIVWSGVLGLFPHQEGSLSENSAQSIDYQNFTYAAEHNHEFAPLPEDGYQREALRTVLRNKMTVVEGAHGTGKTHLAANILLNALSNGQKTAVVAKDIGSLMQIQNEFVKLGLGNLTFLLKDVFQDKKLLLDVLRNEQSGKTVKHDEGEFKITLKQARRLLAKSDDSHDALSSPIFGDNNFSEVVGHYVESTRKEGREILANHLNSADYEFIKSEYDNLNVSIQHSEILFKNVNTIKHPLSQLHPSVFEAEKSDNGREISNQKLSLFIEKWKALHHRHITVYDNYAQKLMTFYESYFNDARAQLRQLKESFSDYQFQFGEDFESNNFFKINGLRATSLFSDRSKNVLTAKDEAVKQYDDLLKIHNAKKHFTHEFLKTADKKDFKKLFINIETYELALKGWRKALSATVQEELQRLNSKTATFFDNSLAADIKTLEQDLESLLKETNEAHIYGDPLSHKMLTLPKRMLFVEETIEKLEETNLNMRDFDGFYSWQRYWINLPDKSKKLIQALIKVKPKNWITAFDSWYFYNTLIAHYQSNTLGNDPLMQLMNESENKLRQLMPNQIGHLWNERKKEVIRVQKLKNTEGYKLFFHPKNQEFGKNKYLKDILKTSISTLTEIYPVLLLTPQAATQVVEGEGKEFDLVIFDNAQNLDSEQVVPILRNTEGVVVLAEYSKLEGMNADSLAAKLKANGAATVQLKHLHRNLSETARQLNQSVFYADLEVPFRNPVAEQGVSVVHIYGANNEKLHANELEIAEVIKILEEIHATPFNTYPRIGVVCMTKAQRNALSNSFLHIIQKTLFGWEKIEQLQRNGLGIYSIEELAGVQFDILIVSGTVLDLEHLTLTKKELRKLLNSFTQKMYWINSVPKVELLSNSEKKDSEMPFLLANLILLAEKIEQKDGEHAEQILDKLKNIYGSPRVGQESVFVNGVVEGLSHFIEPKYLKTNYTIENQIFPLVITPKHKLQRPIIVRIDGKLSRGRYFNPSWEMRTLRELEKMEIPVMSVWSYNWWKNPKDEAFKLVQAVYAYDKTFEVKKVENAL